MGAYSSGLIDECRILNEKEVSGCGFLDSAWTKNKASPPHRDLAQPSACKGSCFPWLCLSGHFPWQKFLKALEIFECFPLPRVGLIVLKRVVASLLVMPKIVWEKEIKPPKE